MGLRIPTIGFIVSVAALGCGNKSGPSAPADTDRKTEATPTGPEVTCPVCGLRFKQSEAAGTTDFEGHRYYFYLKDHRDTFRADPLLYRPKNTATPSSPDQDSAK